MHYDAAAPNQPTLKRINAIRTIGNAELVMDAMTFYGS